MTALASVSTGLPRQGTPFGMPFHLSGTPACEMTSCPSTGVRMVTPDYALLTVGSICTIGSRTRQSRLAWPVRPVSYSCLKTYAGSIRPARRAGM